MRRTFLQALLLANFGLRNPLFYLCLFTKIGLLVLRDSELWPEIHRWAKDTFGPCATAIMVVIIHILTGQADEFGDDLASKFLDAGDKRSHMQKLLMQRQYTLFRTQSDLCATMVMFSQCKSYSEPAEATST